MDITLMTPLVKGFLDDDHKPVIYEGHLSYDQCFKIARKYGDCYKRMAMVKPENYDGPLLSPAVVEETSLIATFSNADKDPFDGFAYTDEDEACGNLTLIFTFTETTRHED